MSQVSKSPASSINRSLSVPVYQQISNHIQAQIEAGTYGHDQKLPSNRQLAEMFKVNHLTVRHALRTLQESGVLSIQHGRGAYVSTDRTDDSRLALILPNLGQEQSGIISEAVRSEMGVDVKIHVLDYHNNPQEEIRCFQRIKEENYNCAIIYPSMAEESIRVILQSMVEGFPLVLVDRAFGEIPGWYVVSDNFSGGRMAVEHLIRKGCRRIGFLMTDLPSVRERFQGYRAALADHGISFDPSLVPTVSPEGDKEGKATANLLRGSRRPDGIFYYNDYQALIGLKQIRAANLRVPADIKIIGFDDLAMAQFSDPALTTIRQNHRQVGIKAASLLREQVKLPPRKRFIHRSVIVPVTLVERESA